MPPSSDSADERGSDPPSDDDASSTGEADEVRRPTPVRPRSVADDVDASGAARATTPTPVRSALSGVEPEEPPLQGPVEEHRVEVEVAGELREVRVRGRSRGHTSQGVADLLLVGFHRPGEEEPHREALVVGRTLEELGAEELERAWARGREPRDPFEPSELFPGTRRNRGRRRGR